MGKIDTHKVGRTKRKTPKNGYKTIEINRWLGESSKEEEGTCCRPNSLFDVDSNCHFGIYRSPRQ